MVSASPPKVLVLVEREDREVASITFELLRAGRELAANVTGNLCTAVLGHEVKGISQAITHFSDEVYSIDNTLLAAFQVDVYVSALEKLCQDINPDIILMGGTLDNLDLAPRLACKLGTQLVTDCIRLDLEPETEHLLCTKPVYGSNAIATFEIEKKPQMATLRAKMVEPAERSSTKGKVISFDPAIDESLAKTESIETVTEESVSLDKAGAIVSGGRGIGKIEGLEQLKELAEALKKYFCQVELGASRPVIDAGWLSSSHQLGLTGEKASPQLYIAVGISGASQHITGVLGSKKIVAINKDPRAPIFKYADYGVVGEYEDVIAAFTKKLVELR